MENRRSFVVANSTYLTCTQCLSFTHPGMSSPCIPYSRTQTFLPYFSRAGLILPLVLSFRLPPLPFSWPPFLYWNQQLFLSSLLLCQALMSSGSHLFEHASLCQTWKSLLLPLHQCEGPSHILRFSRTHPSRKQSFHNKSIPSYSRGILVYPGGMNKLSHCFLTPRTSSRIRVVCIFFLTLNNDHCFSSYSFNFFV